MDLAGVILGLILGIAWAEASAWLPKLTRLIIRMSAKRLDPDLRERMEEEWLRYVQDMPGTLGPFFAGCQCFLASLRIRPIRITARRLQAATRDRGSIWQFRERQVHRKRLKGFVRGSMTRTQRLFWISTIALGAAFSAGMYLAALQSLAAWLSGRGGQ